MLTFEKMEDRSTMPNDNGRPVITRAMLGRSTRRQPAESISEAFAALMDRTVGELRLHEEKIKRGQRVELEVLKKQLAVLQACIPHLELGNLAGARRLLSEQDLWVELPK